MGRVAIGGREAALAESAELARVWGRVFSAPPWSKNAAEVGEFESKRLLVHADRPGFAIAIARGSEGVEGFAYGQTGQRDTWWSAYLRERVGAQPVEEWVIGQFEFTELAVIDSARGHGIGRLLIESLLETRSESRVVLQTRDEDYLPARTLYASLGFTVLATIGDDDVLLGRELPLR